MTANTPALIGLAIALAVTTADTHEPVFTLAGIGGEGIPHIEIVISPVSLHSAPSLESPVVETRSVEVPQRVPTVGARTITLRAGELAVRKNVLVDAKCLGNIARFVEPVARADCNALLLNQGERLTYLVYLGEGFCVVQRGEMVLESQLCAQLFDDDSAFEAVSMPETQIWLNMGEAGTERWLRLDGRNVKWTCTEPYDCDSRSTEPHADGDPSDR